MSQEDRQLELRQKTQQLLQGSLKHVRAAALAVALVPLASVAMSPARAQADGSGGSPPPCDFVTSGGFVFTDGGKEANFGAHGGCKHDGFWGHLNYVDHGTGYHVDSLEITGYLTPSDDPTARDVCGTATTNNPADPQPMYFRIRLIDNGEPGVADQFGIRVSKGTDSPSTDYVVTTRLLGRGMHGGGNVQLHGANPSTAGPNPSPDESAMCHDIPKP